MNLQNRLESILNKSFALLCLMVSLGVILWVLYLCQMGLEFTDEGFYLNWIAEPFAFKISTSHFGFIYHPLYLLLSGSVALMRQVNLLVLLGFTWILFFQVFSLLNLKHFKIVASFGFTISVFLFLQLWLPTPNYNSLNLSALLIFANAVLLIERDSKKFKILGSSLIGFSGYLSFMAKPPSAALLALMAFLYIVSFPNERTRSLIIAGTVSVLSLLGTAWAIDGSVKSFFLERIPAGVHSVQALGGGIRPCKCFELVQWD